MLVVVAVVMDGELKVFKNSVKRKIHTIK